MFTLRFSRLSLFFFMLITTVAPVLAAEYQKIFFANQVQANAKIDAGAEAFTWAGRPADHEIIIAQTPSDPNPAKRQTKITCKVCSELTMSPAKAGPLPGLPIARVPGDVSTQLVDHFNTSALGNTGFLVDTHNNRNLSKADFSVGLRQAGPLLVQVRDASGALTPKNLFNYVDVEIKGDARAGAINDRDRCHGADSASGVRIAGAADNFRLNPMGGAIPIVEATGRIFTGGSAAYTPPGDPRRVRVEQSNLDPYFVSLVDLTTGETNTETVMRHTIAAVNGHWVLDDEGIRLVISRDDPEAFVDLMFEQPSSWVVDPYSYSAHLDMNGLTTTGVLAGAVWTLNVLSDTVEAFYDFGPEGMPFDSVAVAAPANLLNPDHDYTYELGAGDGAYERLVASVPEPATLVLAFVTAIVVVSRRKH